MRQVRESMTIPGLVIGMSDFAKDGGKFTPPDYLNLKQVSLCDYERENIQLTPGKCKRYFSIKFHLPILTILIAGHCLQVLLSTSFDDWSLTRR
ncbi:MAG: hypothetical protein IPN89_03455 [Saprospiraceae bacterium]|nr:hypothetical protein [Saprospiraceae bacterium]